MRAYVIRRLLILPLMLFAMSFLLFMLLFIRPGNAALAVAAASLNAEQVEVFEHELGLDRPWYVQYFDWAAHALRGDLGKSLRPPRKSVSSQIRERIGNTVEIGLLTISLSTIVGISVGIISAVKRNSLLDYVLRVLTIGGLSVPNFWTATLLLTLPAIWWSWTPLSRQYVTFTEDPIRNLAIVIWPAIVLSISTSAYIARIVRSSMLEVLHSDHVRTARAKGLQERIVVIRHVFRASLITLITVIGLQLGAILGGSVIAEQIFGIPGMGLLTFEAVLSLDYVLVLGTVMCFSIMFLLITLVVDMLYTVVDPRIRY